LIDKDILAVVAECTTGTWILASAGCAYQNVMLACVVSYLIRYSVGTGNWFGIACVLCWSARTSMCRYLAVVEKCEVDDEQHVKLAMHKRAMDISLFNVHEVIA